MSNVFFRNPDIYDKYRPSPPQELLDQLLVMNGAAKPDRVVDLGCSTGNSTRAWAPLVHKVIGVEPSPELCAFARTQCDSSNVEFKEGFGHDTGLPTACADIVCAASSIHWMDPEPTSAEIHRILKPGGLFSHYGPVKPPVTPFLELDAEFLSFFAKAKAIQQATKGAASDGRFRWDGLADSPLMRDKFPLSRLFYMHQYMSWGAEEYKGWVKSLGMIDKLIIAQDPGLNELMTAFFSRVDHFMMDGRCALFFVYKVFVFKRGQ